jgi:septum formation protein
MNDLVKRLLQFIVLGFDVDKGNVHLEDSIRYSASPFGVVFDFMIRPHFDVVLASASPRRKELLERIIPFFEIIVPDVDEEKLTVEDPWKTAHDLAWEKAWTIAQKRLDVIAIGADTVVALERKDGGWNQLAKPVDCADAERMLRDLSGKRHAVITAVAVIWPGGNYEFTDTTWVTFREIEEEEIQAYVATGEPLDKAGAYAIQGGAAEFAIDLEGLVSTVIGLPVERLELKMMGQGIAEQV